MKWLNPAAANSLVFSTTVSGEPISCHCVHGGMFSGFVRDAVPSKMRLHAS